MSLRRVFLLGAAALASVAALVAIVTVLNGQFGDTEEKIFATLATTFAAGSALVAGLALLGRRESRLLGYAGIGLALAGFVLWSGRSGASSPARGTGSSSAFSRPGRSRCCSSRRTA